MTTANESDPRQLTPEQSQVISDLIEGRTTCTHPTVVHLVNRVQGLVAEGTQLQKRTDAARKFISDASLQIAGARRSASEYTHDLSTLLQDERPAITEAGKPSPPKLVEKPTPRRAKPRRKKN